MSELQQIDPKELNSTRLLVFIEMSPHTNKYRQVLLKADSFKQISDVVCGGPAPEGVENEEVEIKMSDDFYNLPDLVEIQA